MRDGDAATKKTVRRRRKEKEKETRGMREKGIA